MGCYTPFAHSMLHRHRSVLNIWPSFHKTTSTRLLSSVRSSSDFSLHLQGIAKQTPNPTQRFFSSSSLQTSLRGTTSSLSASPWLMVDPCLVGAADSQGDNTDDARYYYCPHCKGTVMEPMGPIARLTKLKIEREYWKGVETKESDCYHFLNAAENNKVLEKKINLWMPWQTDHIMPCNAICIGSSHGWLAYIHSPNCSLYLYNPFIDSPMPYLPLPPIETLPPIISSTRSLYGFQIPPHGVVTQFLTWKQRSPVWGHELVNNFFRKVVMSSAPTPFASSQDSHSTVMAIYGKDHPQHLAFCRIGDTSWTALDSPLEDDYDDLLYFSQKKLFYAVTKRGYVESWDLTHPSSPKRSLVISTVPPLLQRTMENHQQNVRGQSSHPKKYLVESLGELLMVLRYRRPFFPGRRFFTDRKEYESLSCQSTAAFDVYKWDFVDKKWVYIPRLGDRVLFIGQNHSVSLSANDFPGLTKNSIYFTPENIQRDSGCYDLGVFHLEDDSLDLFHLRNIEPSPIWVVPQI